MLYNKPFKIYKSSAGSGKTFTLVKEYLKLALSSNQKDYYRYILAITFTNKAAEEMKARVFVSLNDISKNLDKNHKNYALQKLLLDELNIPLHELQHRAEQVFIHMLHHYSDIAISTIDKFTHKIIRTFAHDLHLPINFEIEMESQNLISEAVEILISKVGDNKYLTDFLIQFAESKSDEDKSWNIENDILNFSYNLLKDDNEHYLNLLRSIDMLQYVEAIKKMRSIQRNFLKSIKTIGEEAIELIKNNGIKEESFFQGKKGIATYFKNLSNHIIISNPNSFVVATIEENKWFAGKISEEQKSKIEQIKDKLTTLYFNAKNIIDENYIHYLAINELLVNIHSMALLQELENILTEIKKEQNILPIAEFNKLISNIVQNESAPFIYERIGEKYRHYLIDEFQDTSVMQWHNLLPLIHNSLSNGYFNMVVGDAKQSIYRWRGGEVEQFSKLPHIYSKQPLNNILKEREQALVQSHEILNLSKNWRSKKEIVQFNNQIFKFFAENYLGELSYIYQNHEQEFNENNDVAWITFDIIANEKKAASEINEDDENSFDSNQKALHLTLEYIQKHIALGYQQKDICILCRKKKQGQEVADFLIKHNFNVISPDSLLLASNPTIQFIIHLLTYSITPDNRAIQVKILEFIIENSIIKHSLPEELYLQLNNGKLNVESILHTYNIAFSKLRIIQQSLFDAVQYIINLFNLNASPNPYIQFFLNAVFEFSTQKNNSIQDFLEWFNNKADKLSIIIPEGSDAIQIMTIHKSKGLEFPVVIMPFTNEYIKNSNDFLWVDVPDDLNIDIPVGLVSSKKSNENNFFQSEKIHEKNKTNLDIINLLYVAFTRAVDSLHLIFTAKTKSNTYSWFQKYFQVNFSDFSTDKTHFEISPLSNKITPHHKVAKKSETFNTIISSNWYEKLNLSLTAPEAWNIDNPDQASEYGKQFHDIIAIINNENDLIEVFENFVWEGNISKEEILILKNEIEKIVKHPLLNKFFSSQYQAINEVDIIDKNGVTHRPDKIFIKGKEAVILDFKTGRKADKHIRQIHAYSTLLNELGYMVNERYLCYTQSCEIISV